MTAPERIAAAAQRLADLYQPGPRPSSLPPELSPRSAPEAYAIQRAVAERLRLTPAAYKVAMSQPDRGSWAPIFGAHLLRSPARFSSQITARIGIEPEIAFTLARDLPGLPAGEPYMRWQLIDAIGAAHAAIEIVISRFESHEGAAPLDRLADNISNGGLVLSAPNPHWQAQDLGTVALRLSITAADGSRADHQGSGHPLGDPLTPLLWLANERAAVGDPLRAGDTVTTGSYAGLQYGAPGSRVLVEFAGFGTVQLELS